MNNDTTQTTPTSTFEVEHFTTFVQVPTWVVRHKKLSAGAKALYMALMAYADNEKLTAFPGRETLGKDLKVTARTVSRYTSELEDEDVLEVKRRRNKRTGNYYANHYRLRWQEPRDKNDTWRDDKKDTRTRPTTTNYTQLSSYALTASAEETPSTPVVETTTDNTTASQLGVSKEQAQQLITEALETLAVSQREYDPDVWYAFSEDVEALTGVYVEDLIVNRGFEDTFVRDLRDHADKGPRYAAGVWLGKLVATARNSPR